MTEVLTPQEVAERLKVSTKTVQRLTRDGYLRAVYLGRLPRYTDRAVEACLRSLESPRRRVP